MQTTGCVAVLGPGPVLSKDAAVLGSPYYLTSTFPTEASFRTPSLLPLTSLTGRNYISCLGAWGGGAQGAAPAAPAAPRLAVCQR